MASISMEQKAQIRNIEAILSNSADDQLGKYCLEAVDLLIELNLFEEPRLLEEVATRFASASKKAPQAFLSAMKKCDSDDERFVPLGIIASIGFRRIGTRSSSLDALDLIQGCHVPWKAFDGLCDHLRATALLGSGREGLRSALTFSRRSITKLPGHSGSLHTLANVELELAMLDHTSQAESEDLLRDALSQVNEAIALTDWPKFHFTRGRVLLRLASTPEQIDEAMEELRLAAELESKSAFDSEERRLRYALERSIAEIRIFTLQSEKLLSENLEFQVSKFNELTGQIERSMEEKLIIENRATQAQIINIVAFISGIFALLPGAAAIWAIADRAITEGRPIEAGWLLGGVFMITFTIWGAVGIAAMLFGRSTKKSLLAIKAANIE